MHRLRDQRIILAAVLIAIFALPLFINTPAGAAPEEAPQRLPEFTAKASADWINSQPLAVRDLEGDVVLVDVWTFDCWNCYRSIPWLKSLEERFGERGFRVVGVHTPEFDHEKVRKNVADKVAGFGIKHAVMLDNDFVYWQALNNRYWPAFYVVDKKGNVRGHFVGETHVGDRRATRVEALIEDLLDES